MGSDQRFTAVLVGWVLALLTASVAMTLVIGSGRVGALTLVLLDMRKAPPRRLFRGEAFADRRSPGKRR